MDDIIFGQLETDLYDPRKLRLNKDTGNLNWTFGEIIVDFDNEIRNQLTPPRLTLFRNGLRNKSTKTIEYLLPYEYLMAIKSNDYNVLHKTK